MATHGRRFAEDPYENLRGVLAEGYADLPPEELEHALMRSGIPAEEMEGFLSTLGDIGRAALPVVGTVVGTAIGGPVGGAIGGMAGRAAGGAIGNATQQPSGGRPAPARPAPAPRRPAPGRPTRRVPAPPRIVAPPRAVAPALVRPVAPRPAFAAAPAAPAPAAAPAAGQLLGALSRPETLQALLAMALGGMGRRQVDVGDTPVPVGAFANMIGVLAGQAAAELPAGGDAGTDAGGDDGGGADESYPAYLAGPGGAPMVDPAIPEERAAALLHRLAEAEAMEAWGEDDGEWDAEADDEWSAEDDEAWGEDDEDWEDDVEAMYDEAELEDLYESDLEGAYDGVYG